MSIHDPLLKRRIHAAVLQKANQEYIDVMLKGMGVPSKHINDLLEEMRVPHDKEHAIALIFVGVTRLLLEDADPETIAGPVIQSLLNVSIHRINEITKETVIEDLVNEGKPCDSCKKIHTREEIEAHFDEASTEVQNKRMADELMDMLARSKPSGKPC